MRFARIALLALTGVLLGQVPQAGALINGRPEWAVDYPEVVRLRARDAECSATLVGPRVLLTAAHCTLAGTAAFRHGGRFYQVRFARSALFRRAGHDLGVGIIAEPVRGASFASVGGDVRPGDVLHLLGYGCTRRGGGGLVGQLRMGLTRVVEVTRHGIYSRARHGAALCHGDSGGPAFSWEDGTRRLVGVNSAGDLRAVSLNIRVSSPESRLFLRQVTRKYGVGICGVNLRCGERRSRRTQREPRLFTSLVYRPKIRKIDDQ